MITNNSHIKCCNYSVEPFQEDFTGGLNWGMFGNQLLRCAGIHAEEHGFGVIRLHESSYSWVLSRLVIEMKEMPRSGDIYSIETWICKLYRLFTDRCFEIKSEDGRNIGYAYSIWAMINMNTRKPAELEQLVNQHFHDCIDSAKPCPVRMPGRIKLNASVPERTIEAYYSDVDINGHVNSMKYIEHILDLFPKNTFMDYRIARLEIAYCSESYIGDKLSLFHEDKGGGLHFIEIRKGLGSKDKPQGEAVCRCSIELAP